MKDGGQCWKSVARKKGRRYSAAIASDVLLAKLVVNSARLMRCRIKPKEEMIGKQQNAAGRKQRFHLQGDRLQQRNRKAAKGSTAHRAARSDQIGGPSPQSRERLAARRRRLAWPAESARAPRTASSGKCPLPITRSTCGAKWRVKGPEPTANIQRAGDSGDWARNEIRRSYLRF